MTEHSFNYGLRTVHGVMNIARPPMRNQLIAVISCPRLVEIHIVFFAEQIYFLFGETEERCQFAWVGHRILGEHIERRVRAVFFDRQNAGHIGKRHIIFILEP